jgi:hypothetical protein
MASAAGDRAYFFAGSMAANAPRSARAAAQIKLAPGCRDAADTGRLPDFLVRLAALFNKELRATGGSAAPC